MKVVGTIMNRSEERTFRELSSIASDNGMRVFPKLRFSDVVQKDSTILTTREFDFFTRSHFDFTLTDADGRPLLSVLQFHQGNGAGGDRVQGRGLTALRFHEHSATHCTACSQLRRSQKARPATLSQQVSQEWLRRCWVPESCILVLAAAWKGFVNDKFGLTV